MALVRRTAAHAPGGRGGSAHGCGRPMGGGGGRPCMPWARPETSGSLQAQAWMCHCSVKRMLWQVAVSFNQRVAGVRQRPGGVRTQPKMHGMGSSKRWGCSKQVKVLHSRLIRT